MRLFEWSYAGTVVCVPPMVLNMQNSGGHRWNGLCYQWWNYGHPFAERWTWERGIASEHLCRWICWECRPLAEKGLEGVHHCAPQEMPVAVLRTASCRIWSGFVWTVHARRCSDVNDCWQSWVRCGSKSSRLAGHPMHLICGSDTSEPTREHIMRMRMRMMIVMLIASYTQPYTEATVCKHLSEVLKYCPK